MLMSEQIQEVMDAGLTELEAARERLVAFRNSNKGLSLETDVAVAMDRVVERLSWVIPFLRGVHLPAHSNLALYGKVAPAGQQVASQIVTFCQQPSRQTALAVLNHLGVFATTFNNIFLLRTLEPPWRDQLQPMLDEAQERVRAFEALARSSVKDAEAAEERARELSRTTTVALDRVESDLRTATDDGLSEVKKRIEDLFDTTRQTLKIEQEQNAAKRQEFDSWLLAARDGAAKRTDDELRNLRSQVAEFIKTRREDLDQLSSTYETRSRQQVDQLEDQTQRARELMDLVQGSAVGGYHGKVAEDALKDAGKWRWAAVVTFGLFALGAVASWIIPLFWKAHTITSEEIIARVVGLASLALLGGFLAARAAELQKWARYNRRLGLGLLTLEPYLKSVDDETKRDEIRTQLVDRYFNPVQETDPKKQIDPEALKTALEPVLEAIKTLSKK